MPNTSPNILFFMADQMRWDCLHCMGNEAISTPNLDALAQRGMLFRNAFTPNPICVPARASIMTGNYSHECTGSKNNNGRIKEGQPLLTEVLKTEGYRTYAMGKLHFVPYQEPGEPRLVHGFEHVDLHESGRLIGQFDPLGQMRGLEDYFDYLHQAGWGGYTRAHGIGNNDVRPCPSPLPAEHHVDHWIADRTLAQLDRHQKEFADQPFFMFMSSPKPHSPYDPPRPFDQMYDPRDLPKPFGSAELLANRDSRLEVERYTRAMSTLSPEAIQVIRSYYYGCISFLDNQIGRVIADIEKRGLMDDTIMIFTADHGDMMGDFGTFFKMNHLNGSVRIPFIMAGPGIAQGTVTDALVGLQDILPTLSAASGGHIGQSVHGSDLSTLLAKGKGAVRDIIYSQTGNDPAQSAMVCDGQMKYIYSQHGGIDELYDQANDPGELNNLAANEDFASTLTEYRAKLRNEAEALGDTEFLTADGFKTADLDRDKIRDLPIRSMGWRYY